MKSCRAYKNCSRCIGFANNPLPTPLPTARFIMPAKVPNKSIRRIQVHTKIPLCLDSQQLVFLGSCLLSFVAYSLFLSWQMRNEIIRQVLISPCFVLSLSVEKYRVEEWSGGQRERGNQIDSRYSGDEKMRTVKGRLQRVSCPITL